MKVGKKAIKNYNESAVSQEFHVTHTNIKAQKLHIRQKYALLITSVLQGGSTFDFGIHWAKGQESGN